MVEIRNYTFSSIAGKNATNTCILTILIKLVKGLRTSPSNIVSEVLLIKQVKPSLNVQGNSIQLKLFKY